MFGYYLNKNTNVLYPYLQLEENLKFEGNVRHFIKIIWTKRLFALNSFVHLNSSTIKGVITENIITLV